MTAGGFFIFLVNEHSSVMSRAPPCVLDEKYCAKGNNEPYIRRTILSIHSTDRNSRFMGGPSGGSATTQINNIFADDNSFKARFPTIHQIKRIRLVSTEVPQTEYVISAENKNNMLDWSEETTPGTYSVTIPDGNYTGTTLAEKIAALMTASDSSQTYAGTFNQDTAQISITEGGGAQWTLLISSGDNAASGIYYEAGFDSTTDVVSSAAGVVTSDAIVRLAGENFIYLCINGIGVLKTTDGVGSVFAKLLFAGDPGSIVFNTYVSQETYYAQALQKLGELDISFRKRDGSLYDFKKVPVSFTLEIEHEV
jgi:hypothetical protein